MGGIDTKRMSMETETLDNIILIRIRYHLDLGRQCYGHRNSLVCRQGLPPEHQHLPKNTVHPHKARQHSFSLSSVVRRGLRAGIGTGGPASTSAGAKSSHTEIPCNPSRSYMSERNMLKQGTPSASVGQPDLHITEGMFINNSYCSTQCPFESPLCFWSTKMCAFRSLFQGHSLIVLSVHPASQPKHCPKTFIPLLSRFCHLL